MLLVSTQPVARGTHLAVVGAGETRLSAEEKKSCCYTYHEAVSQSESEGGDPFYVVRKNVKVFVWAL